MNKKDLVKAMAAKTGMKVVEAERALSAFIEAVTEALSGGEEVRLTGFGTFRVVDRAPRCLKNPRTGEEMEIPARRVVKFKPGGGLKFQVSSGD